jgi:hypothetical protein
VDVAKPKTNDSRSGGFGGQRRGGGGGWR